MKKIFIILSLFISSTCFSQDGLLQEKESYMTYEPSILLRSDFSLPVKKVKNDSPRIGPIVMLGGAVFCLAGILTTPNQNSDCSVKPFMQQTGRALTVITGGVVFTAGIVITISGN